MVISQMRATNSINKVFRFSECHPMCGCNKDQCLNYLMAQENKKHYKLQVVRMRKEKAVMWGMIAMEEIQ
jgi:hypothetical protein